MHRKTTLAAWFSSMALVSSCLCSKPENEKVRIGITAWPAYELLHLAKEKGYFLAEGIDAEMIEFSSLSDTKRSFERGQIDIMPGTIIEMLLSRKDSSRKATAFIAADYSDGADVIIARSGISTASDLKGKKVGYEAGTLNLVLLKYALDRAGLSFSDIQTVNLSQDRSMLQELKTGSVDAVVSYPPMSIEILKQISGSSVIFSSNSENAKKKIFDIIAADEDYITQKPKVIAGIIRAYFKAEAYTRQNPDDAFQIMAKRETISAEEFKIAFTDGIFILREGDQQEYLKAGGIIDAIAPEVIQALLATKQIEGSMTLDRISYLAN